MLEYLAQLPTATPEQIGVWITCGAAVAMAAGYAKKAFTREPPLEKEFVSKEHCKELHVRVDEELSKLKQQMEQQLTDMRLMFTREIRELDRKSEERSVALHSRINPIEKSLGRIEAILENSYGKK